MEKWSQGGKSMVAFLYCKTPGQKIGDLLHKLSHLNFVMHTTVNIEIFFKLHAHVWQTGCFYHGHTIENGHVVQHLKKYHKFAPKRDEERLSKIKEDFPEIIDNTETVWSC